MKDNSNCCTTATSQVKNRQQAMLCPRCNTKGKKIKLITIKSLLKPKSLATIDAQEQYYFCKDPDCKIVYFNGNGQSFNSQNIKLKVHQKDSSPEVAICYCFDWTRQNIAQAAKENRLEQITPSITAHIKAGRCGCEVNNPQGSCC